MAECFLCGRNGIIDRLERHHIFFGNPNRRKSEKHKLVVMLCGEECHRNGKKAVHKCRETATILYKYGQKKYMRENNATIEDFIKEFGKNYLDEDEDIYA